jgi:plastocyanin
MVKGRLMLSVLMILVAGFAGPIAQAAPAQQGASKVAPQTFTVLVGAEQVSRQIDVEAYFPATLYVHVGDTVRWVQNAHEIHTVTFLAGADIPELLIAAPTNDLGSTLMANPEVAFPAAPSNGQYDGSSFANSGIMGLDPGQSREFSLTFTKPGTYEYVCIVHGADMSGKIVVVDSSQAVPSPARVAAQAKADMGKMIASAAPVIRSADGQVQKVEHNSDGTSTYYVTVGYHQGQIDLMSFFPGKLVVHPGDTVVWTLSKQNVAPHTITFLNGATEPDLLVPQPQPNGPPLLLLNPALLLPQNADQPLTRQGIFNSGLIDPSVPGPHSYSLKIGDITGTISYECLLHDASGMKGSLTVVPSPSQSK